MQPTIGQDWFKQQGGCINHIYTSGICLVGYGGRERQALRPFMSCHRTHSTYLSRTVQGFWYVWRPSVIQKRNWGVNMSDEQLLLPWCTYSDYGVWIRGEAGYTKTSAKGCLDGYTLLTVPQTYLWSCRSYSLTTETGGCIQIYLIQALTLPLCQ